MKQRHVPQVDRAVERAPSVHLIIPVGTQIVSRVETRDVQREDLADAGAMLDDRHLSEHVIYRCVLGSRAYGLAHGESDVDRRGIYLPPADLHWSLFGVPDQLEDRETDEVYWELRKFVTLALKANPNILECLYRRRPDYEWANAFLVRARRTMV